MGKVIASAGIGLGALVFIAAMTYASSWTVRGWVASAQWDGTTTLECYGSTVMTLRDRTITTSPTGGPILSVAGNCEIEIIHCNLTGENVLSAGGNAHVTIRDSKLNGGFDVAGNVELDVYGSTIRVTQDAEQDAEVAGNARVTFHDSHLQGNLGVLGNAIVKGIPEIDRQLKQREVSRRYSTHACDGVTDCYGKTNTFGNISGQLVVDIDATGHAAEARYENGDAPPAVRECLIALGRTRSITPFDGRPGQLTCYYAGTFIPGAMRINSSQSFTREE